MDFEKRDSTIGRVVSEASVMNIIQYVGENVHREGLVKTPERVVKAFNFLCGGYRKTEEDIEDMLTTFEGEGYDQIVLLKDIEMYSLCEHHLLPFFGKAHVAYIPGQRVVGISKLARLIDVYARRLQIQERIGNQVTESLMKYLKPQGAACIIEATHMCMRMRGVSKQNSTMVTSSLRGVFLENESARMELMGLVK